MEATFSSLLFFPRDNLSRAEFSPRQSGLVPILTPVFFSCLKSNYSPRWFGCKSDRFIILHHTRGLCVRAYRYVILSYAPQEQPRNNADLQNFTVHPDVAGVCQTLFLAFGWSH